MVGNKEKSQERSKAKGKNRLIDLSNHSSKTTDRAEIQISAMIGFWDLMKLKRLKSRALFCNIKS